MQKIRYAGIVIAALLMIGIFAAALALADEEITNLNDLSQGSVVSDSSDALNESQEIADNDVRVLGTNAVTLAEGWTVSNDGSKAEIIKGLWISRDFLKVNASKVKETREKYKGDKEKIKQELLNLAGNSVSLATGRLNLGLGNIMEKFKLFKKEIGNDSAVFYVIPINEKAFNDSEASSKSMGTLTLNSKKYLDLTLWTGTLSLKSGNYAGDWKVSMASKTKVFKGNAEIKKVEEKIKENQGEKRGFWARLQFWKRNK